MKTFSMKVTVALLVSIVALTVQAAPKLVLQITVDQLRGDLPLRFKHHFTEGGFNKLMTEGIYYRNAHYGHATTVTAVGHATLTTGANPPQHGIIGNDWWDAKTKQFIYNTEDSKHTLLGEPTKAHSGTSPKNLLTSTIGDEISYASNGRAKVFAVALKDRAAILPGGHKGKAFWFSKASGRFVTSNYYYQHYPSWVERFNQSAIVNDNRDKSWQLSRSPEQYLYADNDEQFYENKALPAFKRRFPHPYQLPRDKDYYLAMMASPLGDEVTIAFAQKLIEAEKIGQDDITDYLSVSLSSTDMVGHLFGPASREAEDNLIRLDASLARLLDYVDKQVGLEHTLVILSADHGASDNPHLWQPTGLDAQWHQAEKVLDIINKHLQQKFNTSAKLASQLSSPYLYLDASAIAQAGLSLELVEQAAADILQQQPGVAYAIARTAILRGQLPQTPVHRRISRAIHPTRSGHVYVVPLPFSEIMPQDVHDYYTGLHGTPWRYDTYVPLFFAGYGLKPQHVYRAVEPEAIVATISSLLGIKAPAAAIAEPLDEVFQH